MRGSIVKRGKEFHAVLDVGVDERGKHKQKWLCGFTSRTDAERALTKVLSALDKGTYVEPSKLSLELYLLDEWLPCAACIERRRSSRTGT